MNDTAQGKSRWLKVVFWIARIWSALVIAITVVILVGHLIFPEEGGAASIPWYEYLMPLSMLVSVVGLIIAWRRRVLGSAICIGFALLNLAIYIITGGPRPWHVFVFVMLPVILPALLFLLYGRLSASTRNVS